MRKNKYFREGSITVKVTNAEMSVKATGAKTLTVSNADKAVTSGAVTVKRGSSTLNHDSAVWDDDKLIITTSAKMSAGTYTVTVGDKSASAEVEEERVVSIVVDNADDFVGVDSATTPSNIYVHYTVFNQYNEDITAEANPSWTSSSCTGSLSATDPKNGLLVVPLSSTGNWNYGAMVYLTGVYTKGANVVTTQVTVKVGMERAISTAKILGVVSVADKTVLKNTIPAGFKTGKYVLAMQTYDQYGYLSDDLLGGVTYPNLIAAFNFISDNPLFIKSDFDAVVAPLTIDGEIYNAITLEPGDYVSKGGTANIQVISKRLGTAEKYEISTKNEQILTSFKIGNFTDIFADGETHEIPFTALDQNGEPITKYSILNGQVTLNSSTGTGDLRLVEQNDGTAKLMLTDSDGVGYGWGNNARDNVDRYVMLISIITSNGDYSDASIYIKDKAYPATITGLGAAVQDIVIEGGSTKVYLSGWHAFLTESDYTLSKTFTYVDQYGRKIEDTWDSQPVYNWYNSAIAPKMQVVYGGTEFSVSGTSTGTNTYAISNADKAFTFTTIGNVNTTADATMTFSIVGPKSVTDSTPEVKGVSTKRINFVLADISQASGFTVATKTMFVNTGAPVSGPAVAADTHAQKIAVTAKVNGKEVVVPELVSGGSISAAPVSGNSISTDYYKVEVLTPHQTTGAGVGIEVSGSAVYLKAVTTATDSSVKPYTTSNFLDKNTFPGTNLTSINNVIRLTVWSQRKSKGSCI